MATIRASARPTGGPAGEGRADHLCSFVELAEVEQYGGQVRAGKRPHSSVQGHVRGPAQRVRYSGQVPDVLEVGGACEQRGDLAERVSRASGALDGLPGDGIEVAEVAALVRREGRQRTERSAECPGIAGPTGHRNCGACRLSALVALAGPREPGGDEGPRVGELGRVREG